MILSRERVTICMTDNLDLVRQKVEIETHTWGVTVTSVRGLEFIPWHIIRRIECSEE